MPHRRLPRSTASTSTLSVDIGRSSLRTKEGSPNRDGKHERQCLFNDETLRLKAAMWLCENLYRKGEGMPLLSHSANGWTTTFSHRTVCHLSFLASFLFALLFAGWAVLVFARQATRKEHLSMDMSERMSSSIVASSFNSSSSWRTPTARLWPVVMRELQHLLQMPSQWRGWCSSTMMSPFSTAMRDNYECGLLRTWLCCVQSRKALASWSATSSISTQDSFDSTRKSRP